MERPPVHRPARLPDGSPLVYEPENEQGVVYLFSHVARRWGLRVERVQGSFPDCVAYRDGRRVRIEFEFRSRSFREHRHDPRRCDWIVCWIHDWPAAPKRLRVVELRSEFGLGFNVWFQPVAGEFVDTLARTRASSSWSVPSQAIVGDLLLFYCAAPDQFVRDIFRLAGPVKYVRAGWKPGMDWMAPIRRVCTLQAPIHLSDFREHPVIRHAGFVRGRMQGRFKASAYWPELYRLILSRNPGVQKALKAYGPERVQ
jgi:hypothetical protein